MSEARMTTREWVDLTPTAVESLRKSADALDDEAMSDEVSFDDRAQWLVATTFMREAADLYERAASREAMARAWVENERGLDLERGRR